MSLAQEQARAVVSQNAQLVFKRETIMWKATENLRKFLERNKAWFETAAASLLSLMAIVVAVAQACTASRQTDLMALQTRITEAQALPQFEITTHQKLNPLTASYDDNFLVVSKPRWPGARLRLGSDLFPDRGSRTS